MSAFTVHANIEGNLTDEPTLRRTPNGLAVANMRVAVTNSTRDNSGELRKTTQFVPVVAWRDLAVNAAASLHKGTRVIISGDMKNRTYENKDGQTVYVTELHAESIGVSLRWHVVAGIEKASEALAPADEVEADAEVEETVAA